MLTHVYLTRVIHPLERERVEPVDEIALLKPIPKDVVLRLKEAKELQVLECDWWSWQAEDLKELLEGCTKLIVRNPILFCHPLFLFAATLQLT